MFTTPDFEVNKFDVVDTITTSTTSDDCELDCSNDDPNHSNWA